MNNKESAFSEEYQKPSSPTDSESVETVPIDKEYLATEKPRLVVIRARIVSEEADQ